MDNIKIVDIGNPDGTSTEYVVIEFVPNEFRTMPKSVYDAQLAAQEITNAN